MFFVYNYFFGKHATSGRNISNTHMGSPLWLANVSIVISIPFLSVSSLKEWSLQTHKFLSFVNISISFMLSVNRSDQNNSPLSFSGLFPRFDQKGNTLCWNVKPAKASLVRLLCSEFAGFPCKSILISTHTGDETSAWEHNAMGKLHFIIFWGVTGKYT